MNPSTKINHAAFSSYDDLPGSVDVALSDEVQSFGVRSDSLPIQSYTVGDTSGKRDRGLPEVQDAETPRRISRKYIPINGKSHINDAVFPTDDEASVDFTWTPPGHSSKEQPVTYTVSSHEKGGPSNDVLGLLKQIGHVDYKAPNKVESNVHNHKYSNIIVTNQPTQINSSHVEFNQFINTNIHESKNQSGQLVNNTTSVNSSVFFTNPSATRAANLHNNPQSVTNDKSVKQSNSIAAAEDVIGRDYTPQAPVKQDSVKQAPVKQAPVKQAPVKQAPVKQDSVKQAPVKQDSVKQDSVKQDSVKQDSVKQDSVTKTNTMSTESQFGAINTYESNNANATSTVFNKYANELTATKHQGATSVEPVADAQIYEQVRMILGESKNDWKQIIKSTNNTSDSNNSNTNVQAAPGQVQDVFVEDIIQRITQQELQNRTELEHILRHRFSNELNQIQQSMTQQIQELKQAFNSFMMR